MRGGTELNNQAQLPAVMAIEFSADAAAEKGEKAKAKEVSGSVWFLGVEDVIERVSLMLTLTSFILSSYSSL